MKQSVFTIESNRALTRDMYEMILAGDVSDITAPGQFVNIKLEGFFLRRPISVCNCADGRLTLLYKVVGKGTEKMAGMAAGKTLDILTGLGNGYSLTESGDHPVLVGGGAGVPPMYWLARELCRQGKTVTVILGFNTAAEVFYKEEFEALGARVLLSTVDGSAGVKGFVTDALREVNDVTYTYACGPEPMLKALYNSTDVSGQYSFEERMGCGFGACMGCSCKTKYGNKRICREGPVLVKEEILW